MPEASTPVVNVHLPSVPAVVLPSWVRPLKTETVAPASAVPVMSSCVSFVTPGLEIVPVMSGTSSTTPVMAGVAGAVVSIVTAKSGLEGALVLPTASVAVALKR